jgi:hypothetical protein
MVIFVEVEKGSTITSSFSVVDAFGDHLVGKLKF